MSYNPRVLRYIVRFWKEPNVVVGYSTRLGDSEARRYALHTARMYNGYCIAEHADGSTDELSNMGTPVLGSSATIAQAA